MRRPLVDGGRVTEQVQGRSVSHVTLPDHRRLAIQFTDGSILTVEALREGLSATFTTAALVGEGLPTPRQQEYLAFIRRYMLRFGVAPAESDIQRHFLVSPPTVNHMMQTLERRGFITRRPGVGRSIRLVDPAEPARGSLGPSGTRKGEDGS